ncbi:MAG: hypothetical protein M4579_000731 [Chaenotheca gracillima]|nr:MAG: hypothetical protein M4579_000731 [Chaenotheca gracillima]
MAMVASPTPLSTTSNGGLGTRNTYRPISRPAASRPAIKRASPRSNVSYVGAIRRNAIPRPSSIGDSSEDELPVPMKFSALTKALLNEEPSTIEASSPSTGPGHDLGNHVSSPFQAADKESSSRLSSRRLSKSYDGREVRESPAPKRVVRLSVGSAGSATLRRTQSHSPTNSPHPTERPARAFKPLDVNTPAPRSKTAGDHSRMGLSGESPSASSQNLDSKSNHHRSLGYGDNEHIPASQPSVGVPRTNSAAAPGTTRRAASVSTRAKQAEENGVQGSLRIKRLGKVSGSFLSGPARRGRRRQSEEEQSPALEDNNDLPHSRSPERKTGADVEQFGYHQSPAGLERQHVELPRTGQRRSLDMGSEKKSPSRSARPEIEHEDAPHLEPLNHGGSTHHRHDSVPHKSWVDRANPSFKVPAPPPTLPSNHDQENEPPPTFKRGNISGSSLLEREKVISVLPDKKMARHSPVAASTERKALAPRSQNTPRRPAPPPPKMSVLETATSTAGAAATAHSKKRRNHISVNGKSFTRLDCIGRGGSSRVYRVMAENAKIFALKKVNLEDVDELTIRGYKGEIELLKKLDHVDRVVQLFDWEMNDDKKSLSVLMEMGEIDLSKIINMRFNIDNAKFDSSFVRHYWKEMLECVQSVHQYDIVHSDLKPANFVLVQGHLKLIDFGIANAIEDDTVNVHREQQVGTLNYMSPEAIVDSKAKSGLPASSGRMMKLGKPSDVWSLGCILYQMVYGKPPFAHITNQYERIMAIPNPRHAIAFPSTGMGGAKVPSGLIKTLKQCLNRDQHLRPTISQLLDENNVFLYPDQAPEGIIEMTPELLGIVLGKVIANCRNKGIPTDTELSSWPAGFLSKIRRELEEGQ